MTIEYSSGPEFGRRQPAAGTLTEAQAAELNERQAMLLPEVNLGTIAGTLSVVPRVAGSMSATRKASGTMAIGARLDGSMEIGR